MTLKVNRDLLKDVSSIVALTGRLPLAKTIPPSKYSKDGFFTSPISTLTPTTSVEEALTADVIGDPKMTLWPTVSRCQAV